MNQHIHPIKAWTLALRPPTLLTGFAPVIIGAALVPKDRLDLLAWLSMFGCLLCVALMQSGANLVNDVKDFQKGVDQPDRLGPPRAAQQGWLTPKSIAKGYRNCFAAALVIGIFLAARGGMEIFLLGLACIATAYAYTGGPFPLSKIGLGEVVALVFFGPLAVAGTAYVVSLDFSLMDIFWGLGTGLLAAALMGINNYRDMNGDASAGKRTLAVRLGQAKAQALPWHCMTLAGGLLVLFGLSKGHILASIVLGGLYFFVAGIKIKPYLIPQGSALNLALKRTSLLNFLYSLGFFYLSGS